MNSGKSASSQPRVLVVEDDPIIASNLIEYLEANGCRVDIAHDGLAALRWLERESFDVLVLDIGLPKMDGLDLLRAAREVMGISTPALILTARDRLDSKAAGFQAGADDYLTKPFALAEVLMRVRALHRRAAGDFVAKVMRAGPLRFDRRTREVHVGDVLVRLMPRSLQLVELLLRDPGRVVPRRELEAALWPDDLPETDALRSQIHILRRALVQAGYDGLETVPKIGYRLRCDAVD